MGKKILEMLEDDDIYACSACKTHLSAVKHLISKRFNGGSGPAYLIRNVRNVSKGVKCDRIMSTGLHSIKDIFCRNCDHYIGWKYYFAHNESEKYKEGNFIIEEAYITRLNTTS